MDPIRPIETTTFVNLKEDWRDTDEFAWSTEATAVPVPPLAKCAFVQKRRAQNWRSSALRRLTDRRRWPRKLWWPLPRKIDLSEEQWKKQHDEVSKTVNKLVLGLITFALFCALALGQPDRSLLAHDALIKLPFTGTEIPFVGFLRVGPLLLIAYSFYLHIFVGYWVALSAQYPQEGTEYSTRNYSDLPFIFNLEGRAAGVLSSFVFYWLAPIVFLDFSWKGLPRSGSYMSILLSLSSITIFLCIQLRRRSDSTGRVSSLLLWVVFLSGAYVAVYGWRDAFGEQRLETSLLKLRTLDLREADLRNQYLVGVSIGRADLAEAHLEGADLMNSTLDEINAQNAHFAAANLEEASLKRAMLIGADLKQTRLYRAKLDEASLAAADLTSANLEGADLTNANLTGSTLLEAKGLTQQQLDEACMNNTGNRPKLPAGLQSPPITSECGKSAWSRWLSSIGLEANTE
jgi:uncharacterized protein YjbI with pentapeptide repeats